VPGTREPRSRVAVFPATFDPPTNGHLEVARKASRLFDQVVIAVYATPNKQTLFDGDERRALVEAAVEEWGLTNVRVQQFGHRLIVDLARELGAVAIVKGLRAVSDFDYELQMAHMNEQLAAEITTVAVLAGAEYTFLSSTLVREVARLGGDVSKWVPAAVAARLEERFGAPAAARPAPGGARSSTRSATPGRPPGPAAPADVPDAEGGADRIGGFVVHDERVR
jgi:pantetheine-phosphate adenylyltransferase